jgi:dipeptidyl aminopeptidase/acylaminoacyl peptidase
MAKRIRKAGTIPAQSRKRRPVLPEDLLKFRLVGSPRISPDGGRIVFVEKHVGGKNEYVMNLWMVDAAGGPPRQFTEGGRDSSPRWSPDGRRIAFIRAKEKHLPQIYSMGADGGEATPLTAFPEGKIGQFRFSPDGKLLAVAFRPQDAQRTKEAAKRRKEEGLSTPPWVIDDWWYRLDGDGYFGAQRYGVYLVDAGTGEHRLLYAEDTMGTMDFDFSPDSRELVVATNRDPQAMIRPWQADLLRIGCAGGRTRPIPNLPKGPKGCVRWSPDGRTIAYTGRLGTDGAYSVENLELFVCDARRGGARSLTGQTDYCLMAAALTDTSEASFAPAVEFAPDGSRLYFRLGLEGQTHVASVATGGGEVAIHTRGPLELELGNLSADGRRMALSIGGPTKLAEVAVAEVGAGPFKTTTLTDLNGPLLAELDLAEPEPHRVNAEGGHEVHLWVMKPPGARPGRKLPAVLEIHGGPHAMYGSGFFHEFQVLAGAGYAVFYANPRGSKGYGRDHCAAIRGAWGTTDWTDVKAVVRFMRRQPYVDRKRMGVMGGSYGGYMTNWVIGHSRDFAGAITDRCVSNLVSMGGTSDYVDEPDRYFPGNFWDRPEARWQQSPIAYLGNAKTPTLIIHSEGDLRCNIEQAEQVFSALKLLGVPTRLVRYPATTSHGLSRSGPPDLRLDRLEQILKWWGRYLR